MGIKYPVNESFFENWSRKMAYTLGYLYADGSLEDSPAIRGKYLRVSSIDKVTILRFRSWLNSKHKIIKIESSSCKRKPIYRLRIGSHKMYSDLISLGLYPRMSGILSKKINLSKHSVHKGNRSFQLRYSTKDSLELFKLMYYQCPIDICLKRKSDVFLSYFKSKSKKLPDNIVLR